MQIRELASVINDWPVAKRRNFYVRLGHNLTIAARGVWSDEQLQPPAVVERLKALNELMHRVLGWALGDDNWPASQFVGDYLSAFVEDQKELAGEVGWAVRSAYEYTAARPAE